MKEKDIQYPVEFITGIAIVQLTSIKEPQTETFDKAKEKVRNEVIKMKILEKTIRNSRALINNLNSMKDEEKIKKFIEDKKLKLEKFNYKRGNKLANFETPENMDDMVFSMAENSFSPPVKLNNEAVIIRVIKKKITSETDFEIAKNDYYKKKLQELKNNYFVSYIFNKKMKYEIGVNQELFNKIREYVVSRFN